jgi:hypothetical protein
MKDSFDLFHEWANKPKDSPLTIPSDLHFVMTELLTREDWNDREKVNKAVEEKMPWKSDLRRTTRKASLSNTR